MRQLERNSRTAKVFARIITARLIGIQHGKRARHAICSRQVVIGDNQVHAQSPSRLRCIESANSGIDTDDEAYVIRVLVGSAASILFMSDSGVKTEQALLASHLDVRSDIIIKGQQWLDRKVAPWALQREDR